MPKRLSSRLPRQWSRHVKSGVLHAISLAGIVLSYAGGRAAGRHRLRAQLEQATTEIALLREELNIKDGRWERSRSLDEQGERALIQTVEPVNRYPDIVRNLVRQSGRLSLRRGVFGFSSGPR